MPNFENPNNNNEVRSVEVKENEEGRYCTIEIANYRFKFVAGNDGDVHDVALGKLDGSTIDLEEIRRTPFFTRAEKIAQEELFGPEETEPRPFAVSPSILRDAQEREYMHEHGEEEVGRLKKEETRHASGPYETEGETKEKKSLEDSEEGTQGELPLDIPK